MHSECSKVSYYQPKNHHFFIINQKPKFCAIFSLRFIQMRTLAQNKYIHILQGGSGVGVGGGVIALRSQRNAKKMEALRFLQQILHTGRKDISCNDVDLDSC